MYFFTWRSLFFTKQNWSRENNGERFHILYKFNHIFIHCCYWHPWQPSYTVFLFDEMLEANQLLLSIHHLFGVQWSNGVFHQICRDQYFIFCFRISDSYPALQKRVVYCHRNFDHLYMDFMRIVTWSLSKNHQTFG